MKYLFTTLLLAGLLVSSSCTIHHVHHDNGKHKGWYKNKKNPHNPNSTKSKAKGNNGNGNSKNKGKGKK